MRSKIIRSIAIFTILASSIGCDQISKNIVRRTVSFNDQISVVTDHFTITRIENAGAFLSLGDTMPKPLRILLLTILPLFVLGAGLIFLMTKKNLSSLSILALSCIVGGGIGNVYDRMLYGSVTDFMHIDFGLFQTGIFNMADVSIMIGIFLVFLEFKRTTSDFLTSARQTDQPDASEEYL